MPQLKKSTRAGKKYMVTFGNRTTHFGGAGYSDRTTTKDPVERKKKYTSYQARHKGDNLHDKTSPGALAWFVLWSANSIDEGIKNYNKQFKTDLYR